MAGMGEPTGKMDRPRLGLQVLHGGDHSPLIESLSAREYALIGIDVSGEVTMVEGKVGDRVILESERTGQTARAGEILEVLGAGEGVHYRVRWEDGHESTIF